MDCKPQSRIDQFPQNSGINVLDLLIVIVKHWKVMVGLPLISAILAAGLSLLIPNTYTAKAMIVPSDEGGGGMMSAMMAQMGGLAGFTGGLMGGSTKADLFVTMLKSESLRDPIIDRLHLMEHYKAKLRATAYGAMSENSAITLGKSDGVITIAVSDHDPKLAATIANAYVEELGSMTAKLNMSGAGKTRTFLEERLSKAKVELTEAENAFKTFQTRNKAVAVTEQAKAALDGVAQLRGQLMAQEVSLGIARQQFTDQSQEVKNLKASIANLRGQIARLEGSGSQGALPGIGAMPKLGQEHLRLMRNFKVQETLVELLTKQHEMSKISEVKDLEPFQVLQVAKVPERKSQPRRVLIVIMAGLTGMLLTLPVVFLLEFSERMSDEDRRRIDELKRHLPLLGWIWRSKRAGA